MPQKRRRCPLALLAAHSDLRTVAPRSRTARTAKRAVGDVVSEGRTHRRARLGKAPSRPPTLHERRGRIRRDEGGAPAAGRAPLIQRGTAVVDLDEQEE